MQQFFSYWLWPNPAGWHYQDQRVMVVLGVCIALIVLSFAIRVWRSKLENSMTRSLSSGWSVASFWFGLIGLFLAISRVETIQFLSMRILWGLWMLAGLAYIWFQFLQFRRRHYVVLKRAQVVDERDKYLPRKKK